MARTCPDIMACSTGQHAVPARYILHGVLYHHGRSARGGALWSVQTSWHPLLDNPQCRRNTRCMEYSTIVARKWRALYGRHSPPERTSGKARLKARLHIDDESVSTVRHKDPHCFYTDRMTCVFSCSRKTLSRFLGCDNFAFPIRCYGIFWIGVEVTLTLRMTASLLASDSSG